MRTYCSNERLNPWTKEERLPTAWIKEPPQSFETPIPASTDGASWSPANRFEKLHVDFTDTDVVRSGRGSEERPRRATQFFRDATKTIIARNNSPDVGFETSINPYRGCEHGCTYCFARPTHEYLGFSAGLDFESKIMVKENAPRAARSGACPRRNGNRRSLVMSGVTDPYQPIERKLQDHARVASRCWRNFAIRSASSPKTGLVTRDIDLLRELAAHNAVGGEYFGHVARSEICSAFRAAHFAAAGAAGCGRAAARGRNSGRRDGGADHSRDLTDHEVPAIRGGVRESRRAIRRLRGAAVAVGGRAACSSAGWTNISPIGKRRCLGRIRAHARRRKSFTIRAGASRQTGEGIFAEQIGTMFEVACRRAGIGDDPQLSTAAFRRPNEQLESCYVKTTAYSWPFALRLAPELTRPKNREHQERRRSRRTAP